MKISQGTEFLVKKNQRLGFGAFVSFVPFVANSENGDKIGERWTTLPWPLAHKSLGEPGFEPALPCTPHQHSP